MAGRLTQETIEVLVVGTAAARDTQQTIEVLVNPVVEANARATQYAIEVLHLPSTSANPCADAWTFPEPNAYPVPDLGGPSYLHFQEQPPDWGEFGGKFPDGVPAYGTIRTSPVREFRIEYNGLTVAQVAILDAHFISTRGGVGFSFTVPRTGEVLTNVRYKSYARSDHKRLWCQARNVILVKATN